MLALVIAAQLATAVPGDVTLSSPPGDDGTHIVIGFDAATDPTVTGYRILRTSTPLAPQLAADAWTPAGTVEGRGEGRVSFTDQVPDADAAYSYAVRAIVPAGDGPAVTVGPELPDFGR